MAETILVLNAGSSSIKFEMFEISEHDQLRRRMKGHIEGIGTHPRLVARSAEGQIVADEALPVARARTVQAALDNVVTFLRKQLGGNLPTAIGHRVVHGGPEYSEPAIIDDTVVSRLEQFVSLAPLHQPNNLAPIKAILARQLPLLQVACFDTAFHRTHPEVADRFAIPDHLYSEGVRRYGFHGLSYEYIAGKLREIAPAVAQGRVVVAHLGSGASMCALSGGKSVESTMGFTALDGLPMGTRPGQLDPGIVLYLMTAKHMTAKEIERFLYNDCGFKGLSGISNDARELLASSDRRAQLTLNYFVYRIALSAGMLAAAMGGMDGLVFTAGIGENAPTIRQAVLRRLAWLGVEIDAVQNAKNGPVISSKGSRVACYVIPTDEELMIARHTLRTLRTHGRLARGDA